MKANAKEWDKVWSSKKLIYRFIDYGREQFTKYLYDNVFKSHVNKNSTLLEVGCGSSTTSLYIAPKIKHFTGLDISDEALKLSKKKAKQLNVKNASFVKGDCFKMPFKDNTFDVVWSQGLLEHFDNPEGILREEIRTCKKNGVVITSVPAFWSYHKVWYVVTRPSPLRKFWPWTEQTFYTKKRLNSLADHERNAKIVKTMYSLKYGVVIQILKKSA